MKLLVATDLDDSGRKILEHARALAKALSAQVWLLHVAEPDPDLVGYEGEPQTGRDLIAAGYHEEHRRLQGLADELRASGVDCRGLLVQGPTVEKILGEASRLSADVILIGSHGRGTIRRLLVGSTSEGVLRRSRVPVLVVPTHGRV